MKKNIIKKRSSRLAFLTIILILTGLFLGGILIFQSALPAKFSAPTSASKIASTSGLLSSNLVKLPFFLPKNAITSAATPTPKKDSVIKDQKSFYTIPQTAGNQLRVPILMYHYVGNNPDPNDFKRDILSISPDKFEEQMKYLAENGYSAISLDTFYAALKKMITLPSKPVVLTFDDGYIDFYYNAYPILRRLNLHATVFIPTGLMEQKAYLTWSQINQMHSSGLISFGSHTVNHSTLPILPRESIVSELKESKQVLENKLGIPINFMAYPFGSSNSFVVELVREAGYLGAVGTWPGVIQSEGTIYNMPRMRVNGSIDFPEFIKLL